MNDRADRFNVIQFAGESDADFRDWLETHPDGRFLNMPSTRAPILIHKPGTRGCPYRDVSKYSPGALTRTAHGYHKVAGDRASELVRWAKEEKPGWEIRPCKKCFPSELLLDLDDGDDSAANDICDLADRGGIDATTRKALINARLGQGQFRTDMLRLWGRRCAVTGCSVTTTLIASHAKPWTDSTDTERLDAHNGLLLVASLDRLFDQYLISFDPVSGEMRVSPDIKHADRVILGLPARLTRPLRPEQAHFLQIHLDVFNTKHG